MDISQVREQALRALSVIYPGDSCGRQVREVATVSALSVYGKYRASMKSMRGGYQQPAIRPQQTKLSYTIEIANDSGTTVKTDIQPTEPCPFPGSTATRDVIDRRPAFTQRHRTKS
jgi:hypothetical protein